MKEVLISVDELKRLKACEATLYSYQSVVGLCPICEKGNVTQRFDMPAMWLR